MAADKFIILHTGVGPWTQGQVIDRQQIEAAGGDIERLTGLSAIRPATPEESSQERVAVSFETLALSPAAQMVLAQKDAEIDRLRRVIGDRQDARAFLEKSGAHGELPAHVQALAAEKDATIDGLRKQLAETEKGREKAQAATQKQAQAAQSAAEESGTTPPPGATPVLNPEGKPLAEEAERLRQEAKKEEAKPAAKAQAAPPPARTAGPTAETKAAVEEDFDHGKGKKR